MTKNILIISSLTNFLPSLELFEELKFNNFFYLVFSSQLFKKISNHGWPVKMSTSLGLKFKLIFLPLSFLFAFATLVNYKFSKKITAIICMGLPEKLIFTLPAKLLNLKAIWVYPPEQSADQKKFNKLILKLSARFAQIIVFNKFSKEALVKLGILEKNIKIIAPAIKINQRQNQETIFSGLAQADTKFKKNFFTIGTVVELEERQKVEALMGAQKVCLSVIPNMQLIIVGEGQERKNLSWLAKKMGIDNTIWFVGSQPPLRKWLDSFDIFVVTSLNPSLYDYEIILKAMEAGLPVLGPSSLGLEEIVEENKTGSLVEADNNEMLARQIIKLYKDRRLRLKIGEMARERVKEHFSLETQVKAFQELL